MANGSDIASVLQFFSNGRKTWPLQANKLLNVRKRSPEVCEPASRSVVCDGQLLQTRESRDFPIAIVELV